MKLFHQIDPSLMMMDQWMEPDDSGEPALNKEFVAGLRDLKVNSRIESRVARFFYVQYTKTGKINHKINQMAIKYTKWPYKIPTDSIARPTKIYPNRDFLFENMPPTF
jgi:hypothetical protein